MTPPSRSVAVLTGDLVASRRAEPDRWLPALKGLLGGFGSPPGVWQVYRGDSFQLRLPAAEAWTAVLRLHAGLGALPGPEPRLGIGVGAETYPAPAVAEANGPAYERSGRAFDGLGRRRLALDSGEAGRDRALGVMLALAERVLAGWTPVEAATVAAALERPGATRQELADALGKAQSTVSEALVRAGLEALLELDAHWRAVFAET
jgi:hypothetical protein